MPEYLRDGTALLRPDEVAERLKISVRAVYKLAYRQRWTFKWKISHKMIRFDARAFEKWLEDRRANPL